MQISYGKIKTKYLNQILFYLLNNDLKNLQLSILESLTATADLGPSSETHGNP